MTRIFVEGHGCSASMADTEILSGIISQGGYKIVDDESDADLSVLVTCSVKKVTEQRMIDRIRELSNGGQHKVIVAGCLPKADPAKVYGIDPHLSMVGPSNLDKILPVIEDALSGKQRIELDSRKLVKLGLPRTRVNELVGIVEISSGCLSSCTFCQVKLIKGTVFSYPEDEILNEVRRLVANGVKEIWLTSTDNAAYGRDAGSTLPRLIRRVCEIPGEFKVRVGMMNPLLTGRILDELVSCFSHEKVFKFLHLPVQTGSNRVLKVMQRGYEIDDFYDTVREFRAAFPSLTLSTDVIVGFPSESETEFEESMNLLKTVKPDIVNLSRFGSRPGTKAAVMDSQIVPEISKLRSTEMTRLIRKISFERNSFWVGWSGEVLVDEKVKGAVVARNFAYKPCLISCSSEEQMKYLFGKSMRICVNSATASTLRSSPLEKSYGIGL